MTVSGPSGSTVKEFQRAAKIQYPDIFANMDMKEEVKEFFELVYQYELTDEQVSEILDNRQE